jgi:hypothetical protein
LFRRGVHHLKQWSEITPLIGVVAYMALGLSVSGFDAFSGIFLGLAFMARERYPRLRSLEILGMGGVNEEVAAEPLAAGMGQV